MGHKYTYNSEVFLKEDDISYYLLGLFITDGNVYIKKNTRSISCEIKSIDYDHLLKLKNLICCDLPLSKSHNNCFRLRLNNKEIGNWLIKNQCVPNKTKIVKFPKIPQQYLSDFIRGLIDGDGSIGIYNSKPMVRFDSASFELISLLSKNLNKIGIKCKISKAKWITCLLGGRQISTTTQLYRLSFCGLTAYKLLKFIYRNDRLSLLRKKEIANKIFSHIERKGFSESELLKLDRLPIKKWKTNSELYDLMIRHCGSLKEAAAEINTYSWTLSSKLRRIGIYEQIRQLFPIDLIKNFKKGIL